MLSRRQILLNRLKEMDDELLLEEAKLKNLSEILSDKLEKL